jgi:hypothetical protein
MAKYVAQRFVAPSLEAEAKGVVLTAFMHNLRSEDIAPILARYELSNIDPDQWYPMQLALNIQRDIYYSNESVSEKLVAGGIQFAQNWSFPGEAKSVTEALYVLSQVSSRASRNTPEGYGYILDRVSKNHLWMFYNTPYHEDGSYGLLWGLVNRFKPKQDLFVVRIIENPNPELYPGTCFDIKWGPVWDEIEQL